MPTEPWYYKWLTTCSRAAVAVGLAASSLSLLMAAFVVLGEASGFVSDRLTSVPATEAVFRPTAWVRAARGGPACGVWLGCSLAGLVVLAVPGMLIRVGLDAARELSAIRRNLEE